MTDSGLQSTEPWPRCPQHGQVGTQVSRRRLPCSSRCGRRPSCASAEPLPFPFDVNSHVSIHVTEEHAHAAPGAKESSSFQNNPCLPAGLGGGLSAGVRTEAATPSCNGTLSDNGPAGQPAPRVTVRPRAPSATPTPSCTGPASPSPGGANAGGAACKCWGEHEDPSKLKRGTRCHRTGVMY